MCGRLTGINEPRIEADSNSFTVVFTTSSRCDGGNTDVGIRFIVVACNTM